MVLYTNYLWFSDCWMVYDIVIPTLNHRTSMHSEQTDLHVQVTRQLQLAFKDLAPSHRARPLLDKAPQRAKNGGIGLDSHKMICCI